MKASRNPVRSSWVERAHSSTLVMVGAGLLAVGGAMWAPTLIRWRLGGDFTCFMLILGGISMGFGASLIGEWFKRQLGMGIANQRHYEAPPRSLAGLEREALFAKAPRGRAKGRWHAVRLAATSQLSLREFCTGWIKVALVAAPVAWLGAWLLGVQGRTEVLVVLWLCASAGLYVAQRLLLGVVPSLGPARVAVEIDHEPVAPGQRVRLGICTSRTMGVQALRVAAVCREVASHGSGSDRVTKTHDACEIELLAMGAAHGDGQRPLAEFAWEVPLDAMHSFVGANNQLTWQFTIGMIEESGAGHSFTVPFRITPAVSDRSPSHS